MKKLHELQQRQNQIAIEMRALDASVTADTPWTEEQRGSFSALRDELKTVSSDIEIQLELRKLDHVQAVLDNNEEEVRGIVDNKDLTIEQRHSAVFEIYVREGFQELDKEQREVIKRAQSIGDDTKGGFTVPSEFQTYVIEAMKAYGGIESRSHVLNTSNGRELEWSVTDGTNDEGDFVGEGLDAGSQDITFTMVKIGAKKLTSKSILVSNELLQDTAVRLDSIIGGRIATRIGRKKANAIVNGTGTGLQNKGLALQVTVKTPIKTADVFVWQDINALIHSVDPAYRNGNFALAFNDNTLQIVEDMEDKNGRPLWLPAVSGGSPATVLGKPYFIDQGIADATGTNQFMYAGDWKRFIVRNVAGMQMKRLDEKYAESDQTAFIAFHRFDTLLEDTAALKSLTWAAA